MKKSIRVLSVLMALAMLIGTFTVMGSAYEAYKNSGIRADQWNDIDKPVFTTEQYATMAVDELNRMLSEEQIYLTEDDLFGIGELDLRSVNGLFASLGNLLDKADQLLPLLGDAANLKIDSLRYSGKTMIKVSTATDATGNVTDLEVFTRLIGFLNENRPIFFNYVNGTFNLGILDGVVADFKYNARNVVFGLLKSITDDTIEWDEYVPTAGETLDPLLQDLVEYAMIGDYIDNGSSITLKLEDKPNAKGEYEPVHEGIIWEFVQDLPYATLKDLIKNTLNICNTEANAYDYIENLLVAAFNYVAVPELNKVTGPWLREEAGIIYDKSKVNNPDYPGYNGEPWKDDSGKPFDYIDTAFAEIFNLDNLNIPTYEAGGAWETYAREKGATIGDTFISNLNSCLGYDLTLICNGEQYSTAQKDENGYYWDYANGNAALLTNIANLARYVLIHSGDKFFAAYITIPTTSDYIAMNEQELYAFVIRAIFNSSVDWLYIGDECKTLADVLYEAAVQFAWQDVPQCDFTKPVRASFSTDADYYDALLDAALNIMINIAVFNLNQDFDMVPAKRKSGQSPIINENSGLLEYNKPWRDIVVQIATWGVHNYGKMLTSTGCTLDAIQLDPNNNGTVGNADINTVWEDIDRILNALIPISSTYSGAGVWIHQDIANEQNERGGSDVVRSILFDYLVGDILNLDATGLNTLLSRNTAGGTFTNSTIKSVLIQLVTNVFNLIFPGTIKAHYSTLDAVLQNDVLANMVDNIFAKFYQYREEWAVIALPVVCDILGLTDAQEFDEMESYMPGTIAANAENVSWQVYNGCSGLNTASTNGNGLRIVDQLYAYEIVSVSTTGSSNGKAAAGLSAGNTLSGGDSATLTMAGPFVEGDVISVTIKYKVKTEDGGYLQSGGKDAVLACTKYAYVGNNAEDDSDFNVDTALYNGGEDNYFTASAPAAIYLNKGKSLGGADSFNVILKAGKGTGENMTAEITAVTGCDWLQLNSDESKTKAVLQAGNKGNYSLTPFEVKDGYARFDYEYKKAAVTEENFADQKANLYILNDYRMYEKVASAAAFDDTKTYYTYTDNAESGDTIIRDGQYTAKFTVAVKNGGTVLYSQQIPVSIILYNDYGLTSFTDNAITANRQSDDFVDANAEWNAYLAAMQNAAKLALAPKTCGNFLTKITTANANYDNSLYAQYYDALADAIAAIDKKKVTASVSDLKAAVESVTGTSNSYYLTKGEDTLLPNANEQYGWNDVKYYATDAHVRAGTSRYAYSYYGYRDYVPHTYRKFRSAKSDAESLINKVTFYPPVEPVLDPNANVYEYNKYLEDYKVYEAALAAYNANIANIPALNPVDVAYALHMVNLTASRLLELPGDNNKLGVAIEKFGDIAAQGTYSNSTWSNYQTALTFANTTMNNASAKPSQINTALTELIYARKVLAESVDYSQLVAALGNYDNLDLSGYTDESALAFTAVLESAQKLVADDISKSEANQSRVDKMVADLAAAYNGLVKKQTDVEPQYSLVTSDPEQFFNLDYSTNIPFVYENNYYGDDTTLPFIAGLGICYEFSADYIIDPTSLVNCYAVWVENESYQNGTGSKIVIYHEHATPGDTSDDTVYAEYVVLIFGDTSGDADITPADSTYIDLYYVDRMFDPIYVAPMTAADVNNDYEVSPADSMLIDFAQVEAAWIAQDGNGGYQY